MNKGELIAIVAKECSMIKAVADQALASVLDAIKGAVAAGDKVNLIGFGTFSVAQRPASRGSQPPVGRDHPDSRQEGD